MLPRRTKLQMLRVPEMPAHRTAFWETESWKRSSDGNTPTCRQASFHVAVEELSVQRNAL